MEKRSAQRIEKTFLEILLLPGKEEKSEDGDNSERWYFLFGEEISDY